MIPGREIILAPLPDVAGDIVQAVAIGRKRMNWRRTSVAIVGCVVIGKAALPDVAAVFARRCQFITPRIDGLLEPAAPQGCRFNKSAASRIWRCLSVAAFQETSPQDD